MNVLIEDKKTKYLQFIKTRDTKRTTFEIDVLNLKRELLGTIHWFLGWRKYVFESYDEETIFDENWLIEIGQYIKELHEQRRLFDE